MSLKGEIKKTLLEVLKSNGMPPVTDKLLNDIWAAFAKTQPSALTTSALDTSDTDVWGQLEFQLSKYGVDPKYAKITVTRLKKKFGEKPTTTEIKAFMACLKL